MTRQPDRARKRLIRRSRRRFVRNLVFQNTRLETGTLLQRHPCQKHPSTKTTTFCLRKTKSGRPRSLTPRRHPQIPAVRIRLIKVISVLVFPLPLLFRIMRVRNPSGRHSPDVRLRPACIYIERQALLDKLFLRGKQSQASNGSSAGNFTDRLHVYRSRLQ
jgi:hypothetical protein